MVKFPDRELGNSHFEHVTLSGVEADKSKLILFAVADSTGHGVPGALVSVVCSNALNRSVNEFGLKDPGKILDKTRELVLETFEKSDKDVKDGMDISLVSIHASMGHAERSRSAKIQWAGANNPLWYFKDKQFFEIKPDKQPVGKVDHPKPFTTHALELSEGDSLYLFTDGFADQFGGSKTRKNEFSFGQGKKFKYKQLQQVLVNSMNLIGEEQKEILNKKFLDWKGDLEQVDDVCVIGIRL